MSAIKLVSYTAKSGNVFDSVDPEDVLAIFTKLAGYEVSKVIVSYDGRALLMKPKAPKGRDEVTEAKRKGIPAAPVSTISADKLAATEANAKLAAMEKKVDALIAALAGQAAPAAAAAPVKNKGGRPRKTA